MNAQSTIEAAPALAKLREPFPPNQISKLPKETKKQSEERKAGNNIEWKCAVCGGMHHKNATHLDYVGHAALTDRLLDTDPEWSWEPMGTTPEGLPAINGGLWIKLTVCGVSRYGFGAADGKSGGDAIKEMIGDALRNAAMRFGAALDLWHKGELRAEEDAPSAPRADPVAAKPITNDQRDIIQTLADAAGKPVQDICQSYNVQALTGLTEAQAVKVIGRLKELAAEPAQ